MVALSNWYVSFLNDSKRARGVFPWPYILVVIFSKQEQMGVRSKKIESLKNVEISRKIGNWKMRKNKLLIFDSRQPHH